MMMIARTMCVQLRHKRYYLLWRSAQCILLLRSFYFSWKSWDGRDRNDASQTNSVLILVPFLFLIHILIPVPVPSLFQCHVPILIHVRVAIQSYWNFKNEYIIYKYLSIGNGFRWNIWMIQYSIFVSTFEMCDFFFSVARNWVTILSFISFVSVFQCKVSQHHTKMK